MGRALVLWRGDVAGADPVPGRPPHLLGNVRGSGSPAFGAPEAVDGAAREVLNPPTAAVDPATGRALALFTDFGASQPLVSVRGPA